MLLFGFFGRKIFLCSCIFLQVFITGSKLHGQNYPVQTTVNLGIPYATSLKELAVETDKISIGLFNKDFLTPEIKVYLQYKIEGAGISIETHPNFRPSSPIYLTAGVPEQLNGVDISDLFEANNYKIQGLDKAEFLKNGTKLPQGLYNFSFRAYDYETGLAVSNWGNFTTNISGHLPPIINLPIENSEVMAFEPQYITIQFTPRHSGSQVLVGNVRYKVRLIEVLPFDRNANEAMQSQDIPFFEVYTEQTTVIMGPAEPQLVFGRRYAVQVQALDVNGFDQFENQGYSEVVSFVYGSKCPVPDSLILLQNGSISADIVWSGNNLHRAFEVVYRPLKSFANNTEMVFNEGVTLTLLKPGHSYEVSVKGVCAESISVSSIKLIFTTDTVKGDYEKWIQKSCGKPLPNFNISNKIPLTVLVAGDLIYAADFEVHVLSAIGGVGEFTGTGTVLLPYTGKIPIPCTFTNIKVNADYRMIEGKIQVLRKPLEISNRTFTNASENWKQLYGENWNDFHKQTYGGTISAVTINDKGNIEIQGGNGAKTIPTGDNYEITDNTGQRWFVSKGGKVSKAEGSKGPAFVSNLKTGEGGPAGLKSGAAKVFFIAPKEQGFDAYEIKELTTGAIYDKPESADTPYYAAWKLLKAGVTDTIFGGFVQGHKNRILPNSIHFARSDGTELAGNWNGKEFKVAVAGRMHLYADAVWAYYYNTASFGEPERVIVGKINLINVDVRKSHVVLVPVNGNGLSMDANKLAASLNVSLQGQGLSYSVSTMPNFNVDSYDPQKLLDVQRELLGTAYGGDLGKVIYEFESRYPWIGLNQTTDTAWLFILSKSAGGEQGYMALNRNYGFLFLNGQSQINWHTVAHETGHGLLNLDHSFGELSNAGHSQNLMDYSPPFALFNYSQWLQVFDPAKMDLAKKRISQDAKSGSMITGDLYPLLDMGIPTTPGIIKFVAPDGKIISLPADSVEGISFNYAFRQRGTYKLVAKAGRSNGVLTRFSLDGSIYNAIIYKNEFGGYHSGNPSKDSQVLKYCFRDQQANAQVFGGFENSNCALYIRSGTYTNTNRTDTLVKSVVLVNSVEVQQIHFTTECLEYFDESLLTKPAKEYWLKAQKNPKYYGNEAQVKRIVRLIHDLGNDYKYYNYQSYSELLAKKQPKFQPAFVAPDSEFDSVRLRSFENYLRTCHNGLADQNTTIERITDADEAMEFMLTMPPWLYKWFTIKNRLRLLRLLLDKGLAEISWSGWLDQGGSEAMALKLLKNTPLEQTKELLDSLVRLSPVKGEAHLLAALCENISGFDGENYFSFTQWLSQMLFQYSPPPANYSLTQAFDENRLLNFSSGFWGDGLSNWFTDAGKIYLKSRKSFQWYSQEIEVQPYDWIYLKFIDPFDFMGTHFPENSTLKLPAVMVYAMFEAENTDKLKTTGKLVIDGALLAVGVGEVRAMIAGAQGLRKAWLVSKGIVDIGLSLGDIVITAGLGDALEKTVAGEQFLENWNTIQLYYGIGSIAESGLSAVVSSLYKNADNAKALRNLSEEQELELNNLLDEVELKTGVLQAHNLRKYAGKVTKGKNLIQLEAPIGKFRQLVDANGNYYRAADLWKKEAADIEHYITKDAKHYIKRDPSTGATLFVDVEKNEFIGFYLDEKAVFSGDYEKMATTMRTVHGLPGGLRSITIGIHTINFSGEKFTVALGRYDPSELDPTEIGTKQLMDQLELLKNYSYATKEYMLTPGLVHILNIPDGLSKLKKSNGKEFWEGFNKEFLDIAIQNKDKAEILLLTDPRKYDLLRVYDKDLDDFTVEPTYFALELKYLNHNGINRVRMRNSEYINIDDIDFGNIVFPKL